MFKLEDLIASLLIKYKDAKIFAIVACTLMALSTVVEMGLANHYITEDSFGGLIGRSVQVFTLVKLTLSRLNVQTKGIEDSKWYYNFIWIVPVVSLVFLCRWYYSMWIVCGDCGASALHITYFIGATIGTFLAMFWLVWKIVDL